MCWTIDRDIAALETEVVALERNPASEPGRAQVCRLSSYLCATVLDAATRCDDGFLERRAERIEEVLARAEAALRKVEPEDAFLANVRWRVRLVSEKLHGLARTRA